MIEPSNTTNSVQSSVIPGTLLGCNAFICHLSYHLFCNTGTEKKPSWKALCDKGKRTFMVSANVTDFPAFREKVKEELNFDWEGLGSMVIKAWDAPTEPVVGKRPVVIKWCGSVNGIPGLMKSDNAPLLTDVQYEEWKEVAVICVGKVSTVTIKMEKPVSDVQRNKAVSSLLLVFFLSLVG